ncbi:RNA polymerase sigma factor [Acrocarpospora corrugata]|uniref:RNA polymerase sigma factor n=1 Tax=Acrocarpospora corrugata TaxID=35763 RepID=A0A5M3W9W8_9ACTN|nr:sigma-70 family RNA polymerase sigma factor [Acrocarpospora corrugata]GES05857.1 RNA polymerase sigma factor [Acrocarpospora corrugata]
MQRNAAHRPGMPEETTLADSVRTGDESVFTGLVERHRPELRLHCYRMLGSYQDAEDLVQETFLRAWRARERFEGRATVRTWLYRIATNACLDALERRPRRVLPYDVAPAALGTDGPLPSGGGHAWLEPYPDHLLDGVAADDDPAAEVLARETMELAFLAAIQHLPPRQRAVLILRDVLEWPADQTAAVLDVNVTAVKSALQRARATMRARLPQRRSEWAASSGLTEEEQTLLRRYMAAQESGDEQALIDVLHEDLRTAFPPMALWADSRAAFLAGSRKHAAVGEYRFVPTSANRQPAAAIYLRRPGDTAFRPLVVEVLRVENGAIVEIVDFSDPAVFATFGLPETL